MDSYAQRAHVYYNVASTSMQRNDVALTVIRRCFNVAFPLDDIEGYHRSYIHVLQLAYHNHNIEIIV